MALSADGRLAFVLTSGRAEGSEDRPAPALQVYPTDGLAPIGRVTFDMPGDDPARVTLSSSGRAAVVTLRGTEDVASVDLTDPAAPRVIGRAPRPGEGPPYPSRGGGDRIVMPGAVGHEGVLLSLAGVGECLAGTLPHGSGLEFVLPAKRRILGRLTLTSGALGLSKTRPTGLAYSPERGLLAMANRSGTVHLIAVRAAAGDGERLTRR